MKRRTPVVQRLLKMANAPTKNETIPKRRAVTKATADQFENSAPAKVFMLRKRKNVDKSAQIQPMIIARERKDAKSSDDVSSVSVIRAD